MIHLFFIFKSIPNWIKLAKTHSIEICSLSVRFIVSIEPGGSYAQLLVADCCSYIRRHWYLKYISVKYEYTCTSTCIYVTFPNSSLVGYNIYILCISNFLISYENEDFFYDYYTNSKGDSLKVLYVKSLRFSSSANLTKLNPQ